MINKCKYALKYDNKYCKCSKDNSIRRIPCNCNCYKKKFNLLDVINKYFYY